MCDWVMQDLPIGRDRAAMGGILDHQTFPAASWEVHYEGAWFTSCAWMMQLILLKHVCFLGQHGGQAFSRCNVFVKHQLLIPSTMPCSLSMSKKVRSQRWSWYTSSIFLPVILMQLLLAWLTNGSYSTWVAPCTFGVAYFWALHTCMPTQIPCAACLHASTYRLMSRLWIVNWPVG